MTKLRLPVYASIPFLLASAGSLAAQDLCALREDPQRSGSNPISVEAKLFLRGHNVALTPTDAPDLYEGRCSIFPIFPETPSELTAGVNPYRGPNVAAIAQVVEDYKGHLKGPNSPEWCFKVTGTIRFVERFRYSAAEGGNGFGYRGYFGVALVVEDIGRVQCPR